MKGTKSQAGSHVTAKAVSKPGQESPSFHGKIILINLSSCQEGMRIPHGDKPTIYSAFGLVRMKMRCCHFSNYCCDCYKPGESHVKKRVGSLMQVYLKQ